MGFPQGCWGLQEQRVKRCQAFLLKKEWHLQVVQEWGVS